MDGGGKEITMKTLLISAMLAAFLPAAAWAQAPDPNDKYRENRKHILFLGGNRYYAHDAVSKAMYTMAKLATSPDCLTSCSGQTSSWSPRARSLNT